MAIKITSVSDLPNTPAVYAMYGSQGRGLYVVYVGNAGRLRNRVVLHLIRRNSSVVTGTSAVVLNPDYVTELKWWEHPNFSERHAREAAELVAFEMLDPALRSRGTISEQAKQLSEDRSFLEKMFILFDGQPTGQYVILTLQDAINKIETLERRFEEIKKKLISE